MVADLQHESFVNGFGVTLEMVGWAALVCFIGYMFATLRRAERPDGWWSPVALAAGVLLVALKLGSVAPMMAAWSRRDDLTVTVAQTLSDLGGALFIVSGWATGLFVATAAASALESRVLPRWLGWFGVVSGTGRAGGRHGRRTRPESDTSRSRSWLRCCGCCWRVWC